MKKIDSSNICHSGQQSVIRNLFKLNLILLFVFVSIIFVSPVLAADFNLSIDPPLLRVQIKPGKSITKVFTLKNNSAEDKLIIARITPFSKADSSGNPILDLKNSPAWISYFNFSNSNIKPNEPFTLKANSSEQLILSLSVPEDASLRDLYATLLVSTYLNTLPSEQKGTLISATIGSNLLVSVTSEIDPKTILQVENIQLHGGSYFRFGNTYIIDNLTPISFTAEIKNIGDFTSEIKGLFKIIKNNQPVFLDGILPQLVISKSTREIKSSTKNNFTFSPQVTNLGTHQVLFDIQTDNAHAQNSLNLFFAPLKALIGLFTSLFLIVILIFRK